MDTLAKNKTIILFEEDYDIKEILDMFSIDIKQLKTIIKEYTFTFSLSELDIKAYSINFINEVKVLFESGLEIEKIASKYNMSNYDIAYIIHMIYNKKYISSLTDKTNKNETYYMTRLREIGFTYDEIALVYEISTNAAFYRIRKYKETLEKTKIENQILELYLTGKYNLLEISDELSLDLNYVRYIKKKHFGNKRVPDIKALLKLIKQGYLDEQIYEMSKGTNIILNAEILKYAHEEFDNTPQIK